MPKPRGLRNQAIIVPRNKRSDFRMEIINGLSLLSEIKVDWSDDELERIRQIKADKEKKRCKVK